MFKAIKKLRALFGDKFWRAKQEYVKYYNTLEIDEHAILLESEHGKKIDGNIFYLVRYLARSEKYKDYKIYLSSMGRNMRKFKNFLSEHDIENVNIVMLASDEYMRLLASAKYLINDTSFGPYFLKKEGQVYLNTWHGTPLKTLGKSDAAEFHKIGNIQSNFLKSDFLLYPNEYTRDIMIKDYMLENVARGRVLLSGYPRNEIFFDTDSREKVREELDLSDKRVYVYMPTYRGSVGKGKTSKSSAYLAYYLYEMDKKLRDDEVLYVNLHPLATDSVNFSDFENIRRFPAGYEVYEFLNAADVLVTDYSSVFFDFAVTGKKTVLFTFDEEDYLRDRGMYMDIAELPFPRVYGIDSLFEELRTGKNYNDSEFLRRFCAYECKNASEKLCDTIILEKEHSIISESIRDNGKENVLIYTGNLAGNGITASLMSLLRTLDLENRNYILTFKPEAIAKYKDILRTIPSGIGYIAMSGDPNVSIKDRIYRKLFKQKRISATRYMKHCKSTVALSFNQYYGSARVNSVIQFNGYEADVLLLFSTFNGNKNVFVHSNVIEEIRIRHNQRRDVLKYVYNTYDNVAVVTEDMIAPTSKISGRRDNIRVVKNSIPYKSILEKASGEFLPDSYIKCSVDYETVSAALESSAVKFINIGRFAPEKGQDTLISAFAKFRESTPDSYLFIIGGYSLAGVYEILCEKIAELELTERVILLFNMPNPYPVLKKCDYFVLSSLYEGFGLVLAEADILGLPVISTNIPGPKTFMEKNGGTLVECSEAGLLDGMKRLAEGKISVMGVDYEEYNNEVRQEFENLF